MISGSTFLLLWACGALVLVGAFAWLEN